MLKPLFERKPSRLNILDAGSYQLNLELNQVPFGKEHVRKLKLFLGCFQDELQKPKLHFCLEHSLSFLSADGDVAIRHAPKDVGIG